MILLAQLLVSTTERHVKEGLVGLVAQVVRDAHLHLVQQIRPQGLGIPTIDSGRKCRAGVN